MATRVHRLRRRSPSAGHILASLLLALQMGGCGGAVGGAAGGGAVGGSAAQEVAAPEPTRELARDFSLQSLDGETVSLSDFRGEWVLLNFWATWCPPCVKEMPYLEEIAGTRDVRVLGVNFNEDEATTREFVSEHGITFPILMDPDDVTLLVYGVRGLPRTFAIAPDGSIAASFVGELNPARVDAWLDDHGVPVRAQ